MYQNKTVIVTGGTKGIGAAIVRKYLEQGAHVITFFSKDVKALNQFKLSLSSSQLTRFFAYKGSITDACFLRKQLQSVVSKFGSIDILINNAGIHRDCLFMDMGAREWKSVLMTNLGGTYGMSVLACELMKSNSSMSHVINVSSISGFFGRSSQVNYACSKGGIIGLTKLLAWYYSGTYLRINTVVPGLIATDMVTHMPESKVNEITQGLGIQRMGLPVEVADFVCSVTGSYSSYVSGTCLSVDGGFLK